METITFETLPAAVQQISKKLDMLIAERVSHVKDEDYLMTVEDLRDYLPENPARQTIYQWVLDRKIIFEKYGKRLYFRKSAIDQWLANGRRI